MALQLNNNKAFFSYAIKLLRLYFILDYGTTFFIAVTGKGGKYYIEWLDVNLNYVRWLRYIILYGTKAIMTVLGFETNIVSEYVIRIKGGYGVQLVYSCLGYGILSFWIAFVVANKGRTFFKAKWLALGCSVILFSNMLRITVLLVANQNKWYKPLSIDHHTFYNIIAYIIVIIMMLYFLKAARKEQNLEPKTHLFS
ncbi:MAG: archaeosortase/exosortase family protein [Chitinophagaceae bacterium]|nr:archaeosortase/exosortase family protein [Chitinophagaceae bacterium]